MGKNTKKPKRDSQGKFVKADIKTETKAFGNSGYWSPVGRASGGTYDIYGSQPEPTATDLVMAYEDVSYSCISLIGHHIAGIKLRLVATTEPGQGRPQSRTKALPAFEQKRLCKDWRLQTRKAINLTEIVDHPLLTLFDRPNPHQNIHQLLGMTQVYMELCGSAFWHLARNQFGEIKEIYLLPAHRIQIDVDDQGEIRAYKYQPVGGEQVDYAPDDILHFKFFNPLDPYTSFGLSPVRSVWQRIQVLRQEITSVQSVLTNMAFPSAVISPPDDEIWNDNQVERVAKEVEERFRFGNEGGVWVQQDPLKYQVISRPPQDLAAMTIYDQFKTILCNAFHIPKQLLDMSDTSGQAANIARRAFQMDCLKPRVINLLNTITHRLCPGRAFFATDEIVEPDETFELNKALQLWQGDIICQNEARAIQGLEPVGGGDRFHFQIAGQMGTLPSLAKSVKRVKALSDLPESTPLALVLQRAFRDFASRLLGQKSIRTTKALIPFEDWTRELTEQLTPVLKIIYEEGSNNAGGFLSQIGMEGLKALPVNSLDNAVAKAALILADSTLRTTELEVDEAREAVREAIRNGLDSGAANRELSDRIKAIFTDLSERRCYLIAETESSRCKHEAELMTIQENGLDCKKVWLADNLSCDKCSPLNGISKELDEPFAVTGKGAYGTVDHPPFH